MFGPLPALTGLSGLSGMVGQPQIPTATTHFGFTTPGQVVAAQEFFFDVSALKEDESVDTDYAGTVSFASSDPDPSLPANSTLTAGQGTFAAALKTIGLQTITATDTVTMTITGTSNTIDVVPI